MGDIEKYALLAAAAALFFWPSIQKFLQQQKAPPKPESAGVVISKTVGSDRNEWIADLLNMQRVLVANNQKKAADLLSQAMVLLVGMEDPQK